MCVSMTDEYFELNRIKEDKLWSFDILVRSVIRMAIEIAMTFFNYGEDMIDHFVSTDYQMMDLESAIDGHHGQKRDKRK